MLPSFPMGSRRWPMVALFAVVGCSRPNPAFDGTGTDDGPDPTLTVGGSLGGSETEGPSSGPTSADATSSPTETAADGTGDSGESADTGPTGSEGVFVYQGPITNGAFASLAPAQLDPAHSSCIAAATSFEGLCPSNERMASLVRVEEPMIDELMARGVPTELPILSPEGDLIAVDLKTWIDVGPEQPLVDTPSVFIGESKAFWTGGREITDPNCKAWTFSDPIAAADDELGTAGNQHVMDPSWLPAELQACNTEYPILCMCW